MGNIDSKQNHHKQGYTTTDKIRDELNKNIQLKKIKHTDHPDQKARLKNLPTSILSQESHNFEINIRPEYTYQGNKVYNQFTSYSKVFEQEILNLTVVVEIKPQTPNVSNYSTNITLNRNHSLQE